jgi:plasmid maintenance system antidote protein VapI
MKSNQMLKEIQEAIGVSSSKMCEIFDIKRASFYRYVNGQNEMDFDLASRILDKVKVKYDDYQLIPNCQELLRFINAMNVKNKKDVMLFFRDVLEFVNPKQIISKNIPDSELIVDKNYKGFYKVMINYLSGKPVDKSIALDKR